MWWLKVSQSFCFHLNCVIISAWCRERPLLYLEQPPGFNDNTSWSGNEILTELKRINGKRQLWWVTFSKQVLASASWYSCCSSTERTSGSKKWIWKHDKELTRIQAVVRQTSMHRRGPELTGQLKCAGAASYRLWERETWSYTHSDWGQTAEQVTQQGETEEKAFPTGSIVTEGK